MKTENKTKIVNLQDALIDEPELLDFALFIPSSVIRGGMTITLLLEPDLAEDIYSRRDALIGKTKDERVEAKPYTAIICSLLAEEPQVDKEINLQFPSDDRPLSERAYQFFTESNRPRLQRVYDRGFEQIFQRYLEVAEPVAYFRGNASHDNAEAGTGESDQPGS